MTATAAPPAGFSPSLADRLAPTAPGATAVVTATVQGTRHSVSCHGHPSASPGTATGPRTVFELGSVTKTMTALLLAQMCVRGEVRLEDPITEYLPPHARPRHAAADRVTLLHLATHTSGLPRLPANLYPVALPRWTTEPYAGYTPDHLLGAAARIRPRPAPGTRVRYSNFGVGLLGRLLAEAAGETYEHLLATRICAPLALADTAVVPSPPDSGRTPEAGPADLAVGHRRGRPVPPMSMPGLPGAGAVRSCARDLLRYLDAHLHPSATPLAAALHEVRRPRLAKPAGGDRIALVWNVRTFPGHDLYFHCGGTSGFTAFVGFSPQAETGLAALANTTPSLRNNFVQAAYCLLTSLVGEALDDRPAHRTPEPVVQTPAVFSTQPPKNGQASALRAPHLAP
ncbi:serine hydrolase domain-containing protein [Streptomyces atrovirens]|uniref:Serine hydrolase domain-containing protein n=1 Tax=Streptomyces atrovirens TaxID=285556 RepID=A0ABW0DL58_9ACTN